MCSFGIRTRRKIGLERSRTESIRRIYQNAIIHDETNPISILQTPLGTTPSTHQLPLSIMMKDNIQTLNEIHSELNIQEKKYLPPPGDHSEQAIFRRVLFRVKFICRGKSKLQATLDELNAHNGNLERMLERELCHSSITRHSNDDLRQDFRETRPVPEMASGSIETGSDCNTGNNESSLPELELTNLPAIGTNRSSTHGSLILGPGVEAGIQTPSRSLPPISTTVMPARLVETPGVEYDTSTDGGCAPVARSGQSFTTEESVYSGSGDESQTAPSTPRSEYSIPPWDNNSVHSLDQFCENCHYIIRGPRRRMS